MKTLGLIGGTTWVSTVDYYRAINMMTNERLGGLNAAKLFLYSVNMEEFHKLFTAGDWDRVVSLMTGIAQLLESVGAEAIVICANTPHLVADIIQRGIRIPIIHIAEETAKEITRNKIDKVILLGTKFTMEHEFFKKILLKHGIEAIIPEADERNFIHTTIFAELGKGIFKAETKARYLEIIHKLATPDIKGVILGCTEIPLLIKQSDCTITTFDTTLIHARAAVDFALDEAISAQPK
jgi:aspartate racemase